MPAIQKVKEKMIEYFGDDRKRINHALSVEKYARKILEREKADYETVLAAAYLHDIGIHEAKRKYNSTAGTYQQIEGPPIAREILASLGYAPEFINSVCQIVENHHTLNGLDNLEFQILYEADWIVNLQDDFKECSYEKKKKLIEKNFKTSAGKNIAYKEIEKKE